MSLSLTGDNSIFVTKLTFMLRVILLLLLGLSLSGQNLQLAWFTESDQFNIRDSEMDPFGNIVVAGTFTGVVDFDHGPHINADTAVGVSDMFVAKFDPYGNLLWAHSLGNNNPEKITALDIDANGNIYCVGEFTRTLDFDPDTTTFMLSVSGYADIFLWALKPNGELLYAKAFGDRSLESPKDISVNDFGDIAITGFLWGNGDMDPTTGYAPFSSNGKSDIFVMRLSSGGSIMWLRHFGSNEVDQGLNVEIANDKNIYVQGFFSGLVDFNPDTLATEVFHLDEAQSGRGFYLRLTPQGTFGSAMANDIVPSRMELVYDRDIYFSGFFSGTKDFDPDSTSTLNLNAVGSQTPFFAWKIDTGWSVHWAKMWNEAEGGKNSLFLSRDGNEGIVVSASYRGSMDLDPGNGTINRSSNGMEDVFMAQLDSAGQLSYAESWGGSLKDYPALAMNNTDGELYLGGRFNGIVDYDPDPSITDNGQGSTLKSSLLKLTYCLEVYGYDTIVACNSYTWINDFTYNDNSSGDRYIMESPGGCDSLVFLHLIMNFIDGSLTQVDDTTLRANQPFATYQWIRCPSGQIIAGETNREFRPDSSGRYAVIVNTTDCTDTSECYQFWKLLSTEEAPQKLEIEAFPNPSSGRVYLQSANNLKGTEMILTDLQGRQLLRQKLENGHKHSFSLPEARGVYLLLLIQEDHRQSIRLIKP